MKMVNYQVPGTLGSWLVLRCDHHLPFFIRYIGSVAQQRGLNQDLTDLASTPGSTVTMSGDLCDCSRSFIIGIIMLPFLVQSYLKIKVKSAMIELELGLFYSKKLHNCFELDNLVVLLFVYTFKQRILCLEKAKFVHTVITCLLW